MHLFIDWKLPRRNGQAGTIPRNHLSTKSEIGKIGVTTSFLCDLCTSAFYKFLAVPFIPQAGLLTHCHCLWGIKWSSVFLHELLIQCVPLAGSPGKFWLKKRTKVQYICIIPVMECGCVFWEFAKRKLVTRKDDISFFTENWIQRFDGGFRPPNSSTNLLWQFLMEPVIQ
jgi:hypothetical protein